MKDKTKKYDLKISEPKRWRDKFHRSWHGIYYDNYVTINGKEIVDENARNYLNYEELMAVWKFAVKNSNKLSKLYLEKLAVSFEDKRKAHLLLKKYGKIQK